MSFSRITAILLLTVALAVFIEVRRGLRRGLVRTAVGLSVLLASALGALGLSVLLSDLLKGYCVSLVRPYIPQLEELEEVFPHMEEILVAVADVLLTLVLFMVLLLLLRLLLRILAAALFRLCRYDPDDPRYMATPKRPNAPRTPTYEPEDAPWVRRHDRLLGGLLGGACGFLGVLLLLSPVLGLLSTAGGLLDGLKRTNISTEAFLPSEVLEEAEGYINDSGVVLLNTVGGELVFDAVCVTELNGRPVSLRREMESCMEVAYDFYRVTSWIRNPEKTTPEERSVIRGLGEGVDDSELARLLAADILNGMASRWLVGEPYMGLARPYMGKVVDPLMDKALLVCAEATPDCVGRDIATVMNLYLIAAEHGLSPQMDRQQLMAVVDDGQVLELLYDELERNPCMAHLAGELTNTALRLMAESIDWANFNSDIYENLMSNLSEAMNLVNGMEEAGFAERVNSMTRYTLHYADQYGVEMPESMARMAATAMVEQLEGQGRLTARHMEEFLRHYMDQD